MVMQVLQNLNKYRCQ